MARRSKKAPPTRNGASEPSSDTPVITKILVRDFKALAGQHALEVRPLTILAGANSSGKSSVMQPLLLMKQTLEASYDPGPLLLNGPNVRFTDAEPLFSKLATGDEPHTFAAGLEINGQNRLESTFARASRGLELRNTIYGSGPRSLVADLTTAFTANDLHNCLELEDRIVLEFMMKGEKRRPRFEVTREVCFNVIQLFSGEEAAAKRLLFLHQINISVLVIINSIHVPGLRGNPQRAYPASAVGPKFPGTFESYAASMIFHWHEKHEDAVLKRLFDDLKRLGLTWKVAARQVNDTQFELKVGRLLEPARGGAKDLVNIADVGFGVSQVLPVVVALHAARPGQLVYLEQPEIHLHPRAQTALAEVIAGAAQRGVRVVVETHSDLFILGVRTLVAEGKLAPDLVKLHWFQRDAEGLARITSADLDERGASGDWPEDFADVQLEAQARYLDAAELHAGAR